MEIRDDYARYQDQHFNVTIESVLLCNATTWRMIKGLQKSLDVAYTNLFRYALNIRWQDPVKNMDLYGVSF